MKESVSELIFDSLAKLSQRTSRKIYEEEKDLPLSPKKRPLPPITIIPEENFSDDDQKGKSKRGRYGKN